MLPRAAVTAVPAVLAFLVTLAIIVVEGVLAKSREAESHRMMHDAPVIPVKRPSMLVWSLLALLFSAVVLPFYFFSTRRSGGGIALGVGALVLVVAVAGGSRLALMAVDARVGAAVAKAQFDDSVRICAEGGNEKHIACDAVGEALVTGKLCLDRVEASDGLRLDSRSCAYPSDIQLEVKPDPARGAVIMERSCLAEGYSLKACSAAARTLTGAERARAEANLKKLCDLPYNQSDPACGGIRISF